MTNAMAVAKGNVDGIFHHFLTGWFCAGEGADCTLELVADGETVATTEADLKRSDVLASLGFGENSGFCFDLSVLESNKQYEFRIINRESGFDFFGAITSYCKGLSDHFDLLRDLFNPAYYRSTYGLTSLSNDQALQHYLKIGVNQDFDPCPWISSAYIRKHYAKSLGSTDLPVVFYIENEHKGGIRPSELFDPDYYSEKYADLTGYQSLIGHYIRHGASEGRLPTKRDLPNFIRSEIDELTDVEPQLRLAIPQLNNIIRYSEFANATYAPRIIRDRFGDNIRAVVCVPFVSRGGADLVATYVFKAYQDAFGIENVLLLVTDSSKFDIPDWIRKESNIAFLEEEIGACSDEERVKALHNIIGMLAPDKIFNINSLLTWKMYEVYGSQLASVVDLYAYLFCYDYDIHERRVGYITDYLPTTIKYLSAVIFDNKHIVEDINNTFGFCQSDKSVLNTIYIPRPESLEKIPIGNHNFKNKILWIGRLARQKRPCTLIDIAKAVPSQEFVVYGEIGNSEYADEIISGNVPNIEFRSVYNDISEIDFSEFKAFLNTSQWDGIPTILIQMMSIGLPIISSKVGGISELVDEETGWIIDDYDDVEQYVKHIRSIGVKPELLEARRENGFKRVKDQHSWHQFYKGLESLDVFTDTNESDRRNVVFLDRRRS